MHVKYVYMAAPQKHRAYARPGRPFATKLVTESGGLATNPPCDKPIEDYSTLHRGPRQGFATEGPRQRHVTEGGGDRDKPLFRVTAIYKNISYPPSYLPFLSPETHFDGTSSKIVIPSPRFRRFSCYKVFAKEFEEARNQLKLGISLISEVCLVFIF